MSAPIDQPLRGIRILDLTRLLPGPMATLQLADMGADVIKIEEPGAGDPARSMGPFPGELSQFFQVVNRGKQLLRLDLKNADQREQLLNMVESADVLVESFRPGVMARLGLGWDVLRARNPTLVMCAISGYGQTGPMALMAGHDINYLASAGMLEQNAGSDGKPALGNLQVADLLGGSQTAVQGILAALLAVKMGGPGRFVDVSMTHAVFANNVMPLVAVKNFGVTAPPGRDLLTGGVACYNVYRTKDHRYIAVGALELKFWELFCATVGRADWAKRHWALGQTVGGDDALALIDAVAAYFAALELSVAMARFDGVDCCVSAVLRMDEAMRSAVLEHTGADEIRSPVRFGC
ncbi:CaiB/BaiF CoA-transferase family protein [Actimicrobium antarcticum]|uniref:CaiB/BaiF CoA-transferase family protein n=1 Tax=Actimicrobium antarcticum TaxID=1051899 RepID=A0ABP7TNK0_9BURK